MKSSAMALASDVQLPVRFRERKTAKDRGDDFDLYRKLLLTKKAEFLVALGINYKKLADVGQQGGADPAQIAHDESVGVRLNRVLYGQLRQVEDALDRLEWGEYGICVGCGEPITPKRLQAIPWAKYCVECQEKVTSQPASELAETERER